MKWLPVIVVNLQLLGILWLAIATSLGGRPSRAKQRAVEFGIYFAVIVILTLYKVPSANVVFVPHKGQDDTLLIVLSAIRSLTYTVMYARVGYIIVRLHAQREVLQAFVYGEEEED